MLDSVARTDFGGAARVSASTDSVTAMPTDAGYRDAPACRAEMNGLTLRGPRMEDWLPSHLSARGWSNRPWIGGESCNEMVFGFSRDGGLCEFLIHWDGPEDDDTTGTIPPTFSLRASCVNDRAMPAAMREWSKDTAPSWR